MPDSSLALVFVHGAMDRATSFDRLRRRFADRVSLAYDRRGYAGSAAAAISTDPFADHVADLVDLIEDHPALHGRGVVVIGHSFGANVAVAAAAHRPGRVVGLVGYEPPMSWTPWWPHQLAGGSTLEVAAIKGAGAAAEAFMRRIVGDAIWERLPAATCEARRREGPALIADLTSLRGKPCPFDPAAVMCPTVIGCGSDSHPHQREAARVVASSISGAALVELAATAHGAHFSNPDGFADLISQVLNRVID